MALGNQSSVAKPTNQKPAGGQSKVCIPLHHNQPMLYEHLKMFSKAHWSSGSQTEKHWIKKVLADDDTSSSHL